MEAVTSDGEELPLDPVREEAVVANLDEALGRDVLDEPIDEAKGRAAHDLLLPPVVVIGVEEVHVLAIVAKDTHLSDGGTSGVPATVADGVIGLLEAGTDVDPPAFLGDADEEGVDVGGIVGVPSKRGMVEQPLLLGAPDLGHHVLLPLAGEVLAPDEGPRGSVDPAGVVEGKTAASNENMEVRIQLQVRPK
jgi:hypothetical protein